MYLQNFLVKKIAILDKKNERIKFKLKNQQNIQFLTDFQKQTHFRKVRQSKF